MGRTRTKKKAVKVVESPVKQPTPNAPSIASLLQKAQSLIVECDYELAQRFTERILQQEPSHAQAKEMLGVIQLETGEIDSAKQVSTSKSIHRYNSPYSV